MTHSSSLYIIEFFHSFKGKIMFTSRKALILVANGSEESEVVITIDVNTFQNVKIQRYDFFSKVLRRAGIKLIVSSIEANRQPLKCAQETVIVPDISINELSTDDTYDAVIVPGGDQGSKSMAKNLAVGNLLQQHYNKGKLVAAICAGIKIELKKRSFDFV
jgi:hypothetical protein